MVLIAFFPIWIFWVNIMNPSSDWKQRFLDSTRNRRFAPRELVIIWWWWKGVGGDGDTDSNGGRVMNTPELMTSEAPHEERSLSDVHSRSLLPITSTTRPIYISLVFDRLPSTFIKFLVFELGWIKKPFPYTCFGARNDPFNPYSYLS